MDMDFVKSQGSEIHNPFIGVWPFKELGILNGRLTFFPVLVNGEFGFWYNADCERWLGR